MDLQQVIQKAQADRRVHLLNSFSNKELGEIPNNDIQKSEENPFEKAEEDNEIEKSDILNAVDRGDSIKISRTGKEIKERVKDVLMPKYNAELESAKVKVEDLLESCGTAPRKQVSEWWTENLKLEVPFKIYDWEETYFENNSQKISYSLSPAQEVENKTKYNYPESQDVAEARRKYNDAVRSYCEILVDVKTLEVLLNVKDEQNFELTPRQVLTLGF